MSMVVNDLPLYVVLNFDLESIDGQSVIFPDDGCDYVLVRSVTQEGLDLASNPCRVITSLVINGFHYLLVDNF